MPLTRKRAWKFFLVYVGLVYGGLYFTPFFSSYLISKNELGPFIKGSYIVGFLCLFLFLYLKLKIRAAEAYGMVAGLIILFFAAFSRLDVSTDQLHFLEHGLIYLSVYLALQFSNKDIILIGRAMLLCMLIALVDECIQGLLPNRMADWGDVWTDIFSYYLAAGLIAIAHHYRRDFDRKTG